MRNFRGKNIMYTVISKFISTFCNRLQGERHAEKGKAVTSQAWSGPEDSVKIRFTNFVTTAQDSGKVVSLMHRPHLPPENSPGTHFC
jgi:hypothetical protein